MSHSFSRLKAPAGDDVMKRIITAALFLAIIEFGAGQTTVGRWLFSILLEDGKQMPVLILEISDAGHFVQERGETVAAKYLELYP